MARFIVTKSVDAFVHYVAVVDAPDLVAARELAEKENSSLAWKEDGVSEFDETDFDNVKPEQVADDFAFGEFDADVMAEMLSALHQAEHWLAEESESPEPGATRPDDILRVLRATIAKAEGRA